MVRRVLAYFIDWYLVMVLMNIVVLVAAAAITGTWYVGFVPLTAFDPDVQLPILCVLVAIEVTFYALIPWKVFPGQTLGKRLLHVRITCSCGKNPGLARLLVRDLVGVVLLEGCFSPLSNYVRNYLMLFVSRDLIQHSVTVSWVMGIASVLILLVTRRGMLHDVIAGTMVTLDSETASFSSGESCAGGGGPATKPEGETGCGSV